ncbi:MAG: hypothetical protein HXS50_05255 [Theionarchaea archaeon]|nr:hypothetical protein [Theionarchaea archaeon]
MIALSGVPFFKAEPTGWPVYYKEDWDDARERYSSFWKGEVIDRPAINVTSLKAGVDRGPHWDNWDFARHPDDPDTAIDNFLARCDATYFGGEGFPNCWINLGAGAVAAFLGADTKFQSYTVWFEAHMEWNELLDLELDPQNSWWLRARRNTELASSRGAGKFAVGMVDLGGILDVAHSLRGKKRLMIDLFRSPEEVKDLCWRIVDIWHACYEELYAITQKVMPGNSAWMGLWSDDRWYPLQCDYAYMLSPKKFEDFVFPFVAEQCRRLDHSVYHLDGYGQMIHLDRFLEIPELDAIQWVPGAGKPGCGSIEYYPMYERIRDAGKGLVVNLSPGKIEPICRALGPEGIMFQTGCRTEEEARKLLEDSENWV